MYIARAHVYNYKFPYIKGWPKLTLRLKCNRKRARYLTFLVDSGADFTLISERDSLLLGVDYSQLPSPELELTLANDACMRAKKMPVSMQIAGRRIKVPTYIAKGDFDPLLGRSGVFEHFDILFQERLQRVVFKAPR